MVFEVDIHNIIVGFALLHARHPRGTLNHTAWLMHMLRSIRMPIPKEPFQETFSDEILYVLADCIIAQITSLSLTHSIAAKIWSLY